MTRRGPSFSVILSSQATRLITARFAIMMDDTFHRDYLVRLPLPLAQLYSRAHNAKQARARHDNAFYLCEALIKLAAAPAIVAYLNEASRQMSRAARLWNCLVHWFSTATPSSGTVPVALPRSTRRKWGRGDLPSVAVYPCGRADLTTVSENLCPTSS